jgi:hypothetical protein
MKETDTYRNSNSGREHPDENELALYAEYLRHEADQVPDELVEHIASCSYCRTEVMAITDMLDDLPDLIGEPLSEPMSKPSPILTRPLFTAKSLFRSAATIAALFLLAWMVLKMLPDRPMHEQVSSNAKKDSSNVAKPDSSGSDSLIKNSLANNSFKGNAKKDYSPDPGTVIQSTLVADTIQYASAFVPNQVYENLVGAKYRSGNDPMVIGPNPGAVFFTGDTLKISWTPDARDEYILVVLDNKAKSVQEIRQSTAGKAAWKVDLKPGLYYWKLLGRDEMWKVGKIMIRQKAEGKGQM